MYLGSAKNKVFYSTTGNFPCDILLLVDECEGLNAAFHSKLPVTKIRTLYCTAHGLLGSRSVSF